MVHLTNTTLIALIRAVTVSPSVKLDSSRDSRVITDVISVPPIHIVTWAMTPSALTFQIFPRNLLRTPASIFIHLQKINITSMLRMNKIYTGMRISLTPV